MTKRIQRTDAENNRHTVLYRFYDEADVLLYVGISTRGPRRWREGRDRGPIRRAS